MRPQLEIKNNQDTIAECSEDPKALRLQIYNDTGNEGLGGVSVISRENSAVVFLRIQNEDSALTLFSHA